MISWDGVLILTFDGFPSSVRKMKEKIDENFELQKENNGSKFPKSTIGAQTNSKEMSKEQFEKLKEVKKKKKKIIK